MKISRWFVFSVFCLVNLHLHAQKENLNDLVPFLKGNKWGIMHHDGKIFYPATLDDIVFEPGNNSGEYYSVFKNENGQLLARVLNGGKSMYLTPDKKLRPADFSPAHPSQREEEGAIESVDNDGGNKYSKSKELRNFISPKNKNKISIRTDGRSNYSFYLNDQLLTAFDCIYYQLDSSAVQINPFGVVLTKANVMAYGDLESGQLTVPFEYPRLQLCSNANWLIAAKSEKGIISGIGIITKQNQLVIPFKYKNLRQPPYDPVLKSKPLIASFEQNEKFFFFFPEKDSMSKIQYDYLYEWYTTKINEPLFVARNGEKTGLVNSSNKIIVPFQYSGVNSYGDSRFTVFQQQEKVGFVDHLNKNFRKEPVYDEISPAMPMNYSKSNLQYVLFLVRQGHKIFYVDNFGKEFISK